MIQSIEIKNFKSIKKNKFDLRNLNILLGLNGQGKSTFIQALLLLRQSELLFRGELKLNGGENGLVNIGTTKDALYQYSGSDKLSFSIKFNGQNTQEMVFDYEINADVFKINDSYSDNVNQFIEDNYEEPLFRNNFQYLNAQRIEPKALNITGYSSVVESNSIGKYGQYTVHYIELRANEPIFFENLLHKDSISFDQITNTKFVNNTLINQINLWLGEISPGVSVLTTKISSDYVLLEYMFKQPNYGNTNRYKPENVGFGISYALHVVTALLASKPGQLIIIENPESHIHPRGQAELGKLIALVAKNDVQVIVETHSDHILNGIRVAVKEGDIEREKVIAFYFKKKIEAREQYSKITDIKIDRNGTLSEYPDGLLDEWSNQLSKLI
jgi:predicted ATPase